MCSDTIHLDMLLRHALVTYICANYLPGCTGSKHASKVLSSQIVVATRQQERMFPSAEEVSFYQDPAYVLIFLIHEDRLKRQCLRDNASPVSIYSVHAFTWP